MNKIAPESEPVHDGEAEDDDVTLDLNNSSVKKIFYYWAEFTATHGAPFFIKATNTKHKKTYRKLVIRLMWFSAFLVLLSSCCYTCIDIFIKFYSYDVQISMSFKSERPAAFPSVSICNCNPFDRRFAQEFINYTLERNNISRNVLNTDDPTMTLTLLKASIFGDPLVNDSMRRRFTFDLNYMLLGCSFDNEPCSVNDFVYSYDYNYGACYTFQTQKKISKTGPEHAFRVEIFLGEDTTQGYYLLNSGARFVIHNESVTPIREREGLEVATNYHTNIGITRNFFKKLGTPYSDCIENTDPSSFKSKFYQATFKPILNMSTYTQQHCFRLCLQEFILDACGCLDGSLPTSTPEWSRETTCHNLTTLKCVAAQRNKFFTYSQELCGKDKCPLECDSVSYTLTTYFSRYPNQFYTDYLRFRTNLTSKFLDPKSNDNYIQKNIVLVSVYYEDLTSVYVEEIPKISENLLFGNVGGNLGLMLGIGVLGVADILEPLLIMVIIYHKKVMPLIKKHLLKK